MATIRDVAREAGVSIATISRVFNGSARVNGETSQRVREAATRLGYWPNGAARSLITRRTHALGVLLPELHGEFFSEVTRGLDLTARREGFHLLVSSSHADAAELLAALRSMRGRIDGLVVMAPNLEAPEELGAFADRVPTVLLSPGFEFGHGPSISIANLEGAHRMIRHLTALGHREIAFIAGPEHNIDARERLRGFRSAMAEAGLAVSAGQVVTGAFTESSGYAAAQEILARAPRPTALFAANDCMAIGALGALRERRLRVPEDISVAGFDDIAMSVYMSPPLTTVRVEAYRLGERALELVLAALRAETRAHARHEMMPISLVPRQSTASPPVAVPASRGHTP